MRHLRSWCFFAFIFVGAFGFYFGWRWFIPVTLPALIAGILGITIVSDLPRTEAVAAALALASIVAVAWGNWWRVQVSQAQVKKLEKDIDGLYVYEIPDAERV